MCLSRLTHTRISPLRYGVALFSFFVMLSLAVITPAQAQIYENIYRPNQERFTLTSPHFFIVYPRGQEDAAFRTARILEDQYPIVQSLTGGSFRHFPVVLNDHNDLSNGFVTPIHFRTEIEIPAIKGFSMNPRTGGWIENVAPHELVHALHFSNIPSGSIPSLLYPFSPDLTRSIHAAAPFGMIEGIAVFHESKVVYGSGGRGNYSLFRNQTHANLGGDSPWSFARHMMPAFYSFPFNRHYTGGYEFIRWLQYTYGMDTTRASIEFFVKYPFLGYGKALQHATGKWPSALYREYRSDMQSYLQTEHPSSGPAENFTDGNPIPVQAETVHHNRPHWIDNNRLLFAQPTQYNSRPGFYVHDTSTNNTTLLHETRITGDYFYDVDSDANTLVYSRYHRHPWHHNSWKMDISTLNMSSGALERITRDQRVHAPSFMSRGDESTSCCIALQTHGETSRLVFVQPDGSTEAVYSIYPNTFVQVGASPVSPDTFALIANINGLQGLWVVDDSNFSRVESENPEVAFKNGIIHDFSWTADGSGLLISGTSGEVAQIYRFDLSDGGLTQLTQTRFGATQPALSPNGASLAYVEQRNNTRQIVILSKEEFLNRSFLSVDYQPDITSMRETGRLSDYRTEETEGWETGRYRTGFSWLRPRFFAPVIFEADSPVANTRFGITAEGGDLLRRHAWQAELTYGNQRAWGELFYRNSTFWPGYQIELFYRPLPTSGGLFINRGGEFSLPFTYAFDRRSRSTSLQFRPGIRARELRPHQLVSVNGDSPQFNRDWLTDISLKASLSWFIRLQQNIRDIQPNTGTILFTQAEHFIYSDRNAEVAGIRGGIVQYLSPTIRYNHGLMLRAELLTQTRTRLYGTSGLVYSGFTENVLAGLRNAGSLSARYVLPLSYTDDGFITLPFFLDRIYLALHANYVADLNKLTSENYARTGRAVYGLELRSNIRIFNLPLDIGIGAGFEPTRNNWSVISGVR